jgi:hypothetical protein
MFLVVGIRRFALGGGGADAPAGEAAGERDHVAAVGRVQLAGLRLRLEILQLRARLGRQILTREQVAQDGFDLGVGHALSPRSYFQIGPISR